MEGKDNKSYNPALFIVESMFRDYLVKMKLGTLDVYSLQYQELKRAYFAAVGSTLLLLKNEVSQLTNSDGTEAMQYLMDQVADYWEKEVALYNLVNDGK